MQKHALFIVENNSVPQDIRVWNEAVSVKELGYEVTVICPRKSKESPSHETLEGVEIYRHFRPVEASGKLEFFVEYANAIFWELILSIMIYLRKPFQIIHSANPPDHVFLVAILFKILGAKYIFDHHDISPENYVAKFQNKGILYQILLLMEKCTFRVADIVISTNESYKKLAIKRGNFRENNIFVVRNGPNLSKVQFLPPNSNLKDGFDHMVAYVGVIGNQEGIDNLLRSVHYLVYEKNITNIKFMVIGSGPDWNNMVSLSKKMNLDKFVFFTGFIPYRDFYEILSTADICVNPEYRNEFTDKSTMIKIMDYMVMGKPIVMFETTEGKVTARESAVYIKQNVDSEFAEAIISLLNDPDKMKKMGNYGKKRITEKLCWSIQKKNLFNAYQHLEM